MEGTVKISLKEGMKITPVDNTSEEYVLIKSSKDGKLYGLRGRSIICLDDLKDGVLEKEWICTSLSSLDKNIRCIEFENGKIVSFDDFDIYNFVDKHCDSDDGFIEVSMREINMSLEEYKIRKGETYEINCRDIIALEYKKLKETNSEISS